MASNSAVLIVEQATTQVVADSTVILGSATAGTAGAPRILTHPIGATFPALTYYRNPDTDFNVDNEVLAGPLSSVQLTEGTTQLIRHQRGTDDVIVTEIWSARNGGISMPISFARLLLEYFLNPPVFSAVAQTYITWQPRDKNNRTYNVEIVDLQIGRNRQGLEMLRFAETPGPEIPTATEAIDVGAGVLLTDVALVMRIVSLVS